MEEEEPDNGKNEFPVTIIRELSKRDLPSPTPTKPQCMDSPQYWISLYLPPHSTLNQKVEMGGMKGEPQLQVR